MNKYSGPTPLRRDIRKAMDQLTNRKQPGSNKIHIELFKAKRERSVQVLTVLCHQI